jgi:hypothetical protein
MIFTRLAGNAVAPRHSAASPAQSHKLIAIAEGVSITIIMEKEIS